MANGVGIDYGSEEQAGWRGTKGEIIGTTVKHKNIKSTLLNGKKDIMLDCVCLRLFFFL